MAAFPEKEGLKNKGLRNTASVILISAGSFWSASDHLPLLLGLDQARDQNTRPDEAITR
jgi:hypothetical protein